MSIKRKAVFTEWRKRHKLSNDCLHSGNWVWCSNRTGWSVTRTRVGTSNFTKENTTQTHIKPSIDPEIASLESRVGLCNALAVALTQSLVWLHIDEVQRIALAMNTLAKLDLLVFDEFVGHRAYFELLRKSTELVFDDQGNGYRPELGFIFQKLGYKNLNFTF